MNTQKRQTNKKGERQNAPWWDETCAELVKCRAEVRRRFRKGFTMEEFEFWRQVEITTKKRLREIKNEKLKGSDKGKINANADSKALLEKNTEALKNITITAKKSYDSDKDNGVVENAGKVTSEQGSSQHPQTSESELENQTASADTAANSI